MENEASRRIAGLFAGVGGFELGLGSAGHEISMLCELWEPAVEVLRSHPRFEGTSIHRDVTSLKTSDVPDEVDLVTAGFPCTDLSQVGRKAGIGGDQSRLVFCVFELLAEFKKIGRPLPELLIENVPNMLNLGKGKAMEVLVECLEGLGYRWAYRTVDSRFSGVPQRRRRVFLFASQTRDPGCVLFADEAVESPDMYSNSSFGFYWTEGRRGLGWAVDAVPTLKGGSNIGIPSPPAIWVPTAAVGRRIVAPTIEDAELLQGLPRGHTAAAQTHRSNGPRWKLVGNAVTVGVARWLGERIANPGTQVVEEAGWDCAARWPSAAKGSRGVRSIVYAGEFPRVDPYRHLVDVVSLEDAQPLSLRATRGFWSRLRETNLGREPGFRDALTVHIDHQEKVARSAAA